MSVILETVCVIYCKHVQDKVKVPVDMMNREKNLAILFYPDTGEGSANINVPLAPFKIGSQLKNAGFEVAVIDERLEAGYHKRLEGLLDNALFFGVSAMTGRQIYGGLEASRFVKGLNSELPVVWGGWHPSILPEETLKNANIDIIVKGQGERTAVELAAALKKEEKLEAIDGILYKEAGNIRANKARGLEDLNTFGPARFDTVDLEKYIFKNYLGKRCSGSTAGERYRP